jgi:citrate lyase subunit beta/citryl-CoA lyase
MIAKAATSAADEVILDLEDSVAPEQKSVARETIIRALREIDFARKYVTVRPNNVATAYCYREVVDIVEQSHQRLDGLVIPKVMDVRDVQFVATLLDGIERSVASSRSIGIEVLIEAARGLEVAYQAASCSPRVTGLIFGIADYAGELGASQDTLKGMDQFSCYAYAKQRVLQSARAAGVDAVDNATIDFRDDATCRADAELASRMGFDGKWAIHPRQVEIINAAFSPTPEAVAQSRRIVEIYLAAERQGSGAVAIDGKLVDAAVIRIERRKLARARQAGLVEASSVDHLLAAG